MTQEKVIFEPTQIIIDTKIKSSTKEIQKKIEELDLELEDNTINQILFVDKIRQKIEPQTRKLAKQTIEKIIRTLQDSPEFLSHMEENLIKIAEYEEEITGPGQYPIPTEAIYSNFLKYLIIEGLKESMSIQGEWGIYTYNRTNLKRWNEEVFFNPHRPEMRRYDFQIIKNDIMTRRKIAYEVLLRTTPRLSMPLVEEAQREITQTR